MIPPLPSFWNSPEAPETGELATIGILTGQANSYNILARKKAVAPFNKGAKTLHVDIAGLTTGILPLPSGRLTAVSCQHQKQKGHLRQPFLFLVEAAGFEPASENHQPMVLHA